MAVRREALTGCDTVFIDNAEVAKSHKLGIIVISKRKGVVSIQPTEIETPTLI